MLLQTGLRFELCIQLSFASFKPIEEQLERGISFQSILQSQSDRFIRALGDLLDWLPLPEASAYFEKIHRFDSLLKEKMLKPCLYPLFILAFVSALVWFFSTSILPSMAVWSDGTSLWMLEGMKLLLLAFWTLAALVGLLFAVLYCSGNTQLLTWLVFRIPLLKRAASLQCALLFDCASQYGLSTRQLIDLMDHRRLFLFASLMARRWRQKSEEGASLMDSIQHDSLLDAAFQRCFSLGLSGSGMTAMMEAYQQACLRALELKMKKFSAVVLCLSYTFVGLLALCVYQIMLEPLTTLEGI